MTAPVGLPPGPYQLETTRPELEPGAGHIYLVDANGRKIASIWGSPAEKISLVNFIIDTEERSRTP